jgi:hypothetical protein
MGMEEDPDPKNREAVVANIFIAVAIYGVRLSLRHLFPTHPVCALRGAGIRRPVRILFHELLTLLAGLLRILRITGISTRAGEPEGSDLTSMSVRGDSSRKSGSGERLDGGLHIQS